MVRGDLLDGMVAQLRCLDVDLGDERDVIVKLKSLGYTGSDIIACLDSVIAETRRRGLKRSWA